MPVGKLFAKRLKLLILGLPLAGAMGASLLPVQPWIHQALVGVAILWAYVTLLSGLNR